MIQKNIVGPLRDQSDWEQQNENRLGFIKNKPFYDNRTTEPLTIEWDGIEREGQETFEIPDIPLRCTKLSDAVPTIEEVRAGYIVFEGGEEAGTHPNEEYIMEGSFGFSCGGFFFIPQTCSVGEYIISAGTWGVIADFATEMGVTKITLQLPSVTTGELKTIDPKYLPKQGMPLLIYAEPRGPVNIVGEAKNMSYFDVVKAINEGTLYGAFCNWMGNNLVPCSVDIGLATDAEQSYICIELVERTAGPIIVLYWTPDGTISNEHPYPAQE